MNNLPTRHVCYHYGYNNTSSSSTFDNLSTLIRENKQALTTTDAMAMTPLHILCCNPHATAEAIQIIANVQPALLNQADMTGYTPLRLFMVRRNLV